MLKHKIMDTRIKSYFDLTKEELYDLLALRIEVFVIEQNCPYQDLDGVDKTAYHLITNDGGATVATLRIYIDNNNVVHIGRVVVAQTHRKTRLGRLIMSKAIDWSKNNYSERKIHISAQQYLDDFYTNLGFKSTGKKYLEDGIPHQEMVL